MENVHPIAVHFPIALLTTAFVLETLALAFRRPEWGRVALWMMGAGTLAATAAVITGRMAAAAAKHSMEIHEVMKAHQAAGYVALSLAVASAGWRVALRGRLTGWRRWVAWGLLGGACAALAAGAHLGGRLVYEFGVGGSYGRQSGIEVVR